MSDIARLGLVVDSRPVADASKVLADFARAGKPAEDAANRIVAAMDRSKRPAQEMVKYTGLARYEMINLGRQVQDVGVSLVSGQSPFMVLAQQGAQIYDIFNSSQGSLRGFAAQLRGMIGPTTLLVGGLVALGGVTYAALSYWKSYALALDDLSRVTGVATVELSKLQSAAAVKGIGQEDFVTGMQRFAQSVYEAKAGTSELATLLRLNGETVSDTATTFDTIANLVQRASGDTQKQFSILRSAGLPATMEFVRLLSSGAEGLRKAKEEAVSLGGAVNDQMVAKAREFDEAWNKAWTNFGRSAKSSITDAVSGISGLLDSAANQLLKWNPGLSAGLSPKSTIDFRWPSSLEQMKQEDRTKKDPVKDAEWLAQRQHEIQLEQQKISLLGETATATDRRREVELRLQAAGLAGINLTEAQIAKIREYADAERSLSEVRERLGILGAAATDAERYSARLQELSVALRRGKIDQEQFNRAILDASPIYAGISASLESNITSGLTNFATGAKTAQAAFYEMTQAILRDIVQITIRMMILRPLMEGIAGGGGLGGIASTLFGAGAHHTGYGPGDPFTETRLIPASAVASAPRFHSGVGPGERVAVLRDDESVLTPGQMRQLAPVGGGAGGTTFAPTINVSMPPGGKPEDGARFGKEISRVIRAEVMDVFVRQKRAGGMLS